MSDQELAETIEKEAAQHIPFDLGDVNLDYQILSEDSGNPQMDVLLVAVKKDKILNYTNVLSMAGKTPAIVDIDALALQNCYEFNYEPAPGPARMAPWAKLSRLCARWMISIRSPIPPKRMVCSPTMSPARMAWTPISACFRSPTMPRRP